MMIDAATEDTEGAEPGEGSVAHACNQRLGRYRLCFEVAHGGMATVYLARVDGPAGFGKLVALKRIHPHLARERAFVDMFLDEARIASQLGHPNLCGVTDFGEAEGTYYLTMEYLVGESLGHVHDRLAQRQRAGTLPDLIPIACRIVADACEGLHSAHELKGPLGKPLELVHRDVSPHNLFVTYEGAVKVVDFGIASAAGRLHHTKAGAVKGKFPYMAPEVLEGKGLDRRADVWALGVVLWETIAVRRLFRQHSDSETLLAVMQKPIPRLSEVRSGVPPELDQIVHKALTRRPEERYASARELGQDLSRFLATRREAVALVDVAGFMQELFPDGFAKKQQLLQIALQVDDGVVPSVPQGRPEGTSTLSFRSVSSSLSRVLWARRPLLPAALLAGLFGCGALLAAALWDEPEAHPEPAPVRAQAPGPPVAAGAELGYHELSAPMTLAHPQAAQSGAGGAPAAALAPSAASGASSLLPERSLTSNPAKPARARSARRARADRIYRRD